MEKDKIDYLNNKIESLPVAEALAFTLEAVPGKKVFSTSFGIEDQLLTHYIAGFANDVNIFTLDTGRHFNETYEVFQKILDKYPGLSIEIFYPEEGDVNTYIKSRGVNGFYNSIENRKECCHIRKVKPLARAIAGASLWITGLRADQSHNREMMQLLEWDEVNKLLKFNPLLHYTLQDVEAEINKYKIPVSSLYKKGYLSIGCAPCTRALAEGEDFRSGRWWWEGGKKECGLHVHSQKKLLI